MSGIGGAELTSHLTATRSYRFGVGGAAGTGTVWFAVIDRNGDLSGKLRIPAFELAA
jgi:hypothetical protein